MGNPALWAGSLIASMTTHAFDQDTAVVKAGDNEFHGHLHERWTIAGVPNGGYVMAVMLRAAQEVSHHLDPLTTTAHFLSPTAPGPATVLTEVVKPGRSTTTVVTALSQEGRERIRMLTTLGHLAGRTGPTHSYLVPPAMEPPFIEERSSLMQEFPKNFDFRIPKSVAGGVVGEPTGQPEMGGTIAFSDGRAPDLLCLPVIADGFAPTMFNLGYEAWTPTLELTIHFWNHPAPGPVTVWLHSGVVEQGFHDESADLWDSEGNLVARSRQFALIL